MKALILIVFLFVLLAAFYSSAAQQQCMAHWTCSSSQCSAVMGGSSGDAGPFDSESACRSWSNTYNRSSSCTCNSTSAAASSSGSLSQDFGKVFANMTPQQQTATVIGTYGLGMILQSLSKLGQPKQPSPGMSAAEIARRKQLNDQRLTQMQADLVDGNNGLALKTGDGTSPSASTQSGNPLGLKLGDAAAAPLPSSPQDEAYLRGMHDAANCVSQNAGPYCAAHPASDTQSCAESYHRGYALGEQAAQNALKAAYDLGTADHAANRKFSANTGDASNSCGVHAIEAYSEGYFDKPFTLIDK